MTTLQSSPSTNGQPDRSDNGTAVTSQPISQSNTGVYQSWTRF